MHTGSEWILLKSIVFKDQDRLSSVLFCTLCPGTLASHPRIYVSMVLSKATLWAGVLQRIVASFAFYNMSGHLIDKLRNLNMNDFMRTNSTLKH